MAVGTVGGVEAVDRRILAFVGAHQFVASAQACDFLEVEKALVGERLSRLVDGGLLRGERLSLSWPGVIRVTPSGLPAIGSRLAAPVLELSGVRRELAVVGLWIRGWQGTLGLVDRTLSRREMIGLDRAAAEVGESDNGFALPAGVVGAVPRYPDLLLAAGDDRMPVLLLTWPHRPTDVSGLLTGFLALPNVAFVNVCVDREQAAVEVGVLADQLGVAERVRVRNVSIGTVPPMG